MLGRKKDLRLLLTPGACWSISGISLQVAWSSMISGEVVSVARDVIDSTLNQFSWVTVCLYNRLVEFA